MLMRTPFEPSVSGSNGEMRNDGMSELSAQAESERYEIRSDDVSRETQKLSFFS